MTSRIVLADVYKNVQELLNIIRIERTLLRTTFSFEYIKMNSLLLELSFRSNKQNSI